MIFSNVHALFSVGRSNFACDEELSSFSTDTQGHALIYGMDLTMLRTLFSLFEEITRFLLLTCVPRFATGSQNTKRQSQSDNRFWHGVILVMERSINRLLKEEMRINNH